MAAYGFSFNCISLVMAGESKGLAQVLPLFKDCPAMLIVQEQSKINFS
jgi:hypothetical protein